MTNEELIQKALEVRKKAYVPYSHHPVGAALLTKSGHVYTGCNVENAAFGPGICAERTAVVKAVSEGERDFVRIAVVGGPENAEHLPLCPPCGICRQVLNEFAEPGSFEVILGTDDPENMKVLKLEELLPYGFGPKNMDF